MDKTTEAFLFTATIIAVIGGLILLSRVISQHFVISGTLVFLGAVGLGHGCHYSERNDPPRPPSAPSYYNRTPPTEIIDAEHKNFAIVMREYEDRKRAYDDRAYKTHPTGIPTWVSWFGGTALLIMGGIWLMLRLIVAYLSYK